MKSKIYLLMAEVGAWDDYMINPVLAFNSKELATKACDGLTDIIDSLKEQSRSLNREEEDNNFMTEFERFWDKAGIDPFYIPTYLVRELEIILE